MEELRRIFAEAGLPENEIESMIEKLELTEVPDLALYLEERDYIEAGVTSPKTRKKLLRIAKEIDESLKEQKEQEKLAAKNSQTAQKLDLTLLANYKDDDTLIESLEQEGMLHFGQNVYMAGIKAVLASNLGVFASVEKLYNMILDYSVENSLPASKLLYDLQAIITRRTAGLIFAVSEENRVNGVPIYATSAEVAELMERIRTYLIPAILSAADKVNNWNSLLTAQKTSDYFVEHMMSSQQAGQMDNMPSPAAIYDAGIELRNSINRTFAGNGIQKALAILNEYLEFVKILNDPDLPKAVGLVNKDAILLKLGFDVNHAAIRSERYVTSFVLSMIDAKNLAKDHEMQFFRQLNNLNNQIDWSALTNNPADAERFGVVSGPFGVGVSTVLGVGTTHQRAQLADNGAGRPALQQLSGQPVTVENN